jgi:hypothetical protein
MVVVVVVVGVWPDSKVGQQPCRDTWMGQRRQYPGPRPGPETETAGREIIEMLRWSITEGWWSAGHFATRKWQPPITWLDGSPPLCTLEKNFN